MAVVDNIALFLFGFSIIESNRYIDFQKVIAGPDILATLNIGNYTGTELAAEIKRALEFADGVNTYTVTINRTVNANHENRMTIASSSGFFTLLFGSGTNAGSSIAPLIGFSASDYTGLTSYTGFRSAGIILIPDFATWNYTGPEEMVKSDGSKNVSSSGIKETLVFAQVQFFQGEWRYITNFQGNTQKDQWIVFLKYATKQLKLEFTPSINEDPNLFYGCTLESTPADGNGMAYELQLMVGEGLFRFYKTGMLKFRLNTVI